MSLVPCMLVPQAALQRKLVEVQLQSSSKKLSEKNCVAIVAKLIEQKHLEVCVCVCVCLPV